MIQFYIRGFLLLLNILHCVEGNFIMFNKVPISTIEFPEGRFKMFTDISLPEKGNLEDATILSLSTLSTTPTSRVHRRGGSGGGRVVKLLACGARGLGFDSRPRHSKIQRLVISCFQVAIWLKYRWSDENPEYNQPPKNIDGTMEGLVCSVPSSRIELDLFSHMRLRKPTGSTLLWTCSTGYLCAPCKS